MNGKKTLDFLSKQKIEKPYKKLLLLHLNP